MQASAMPDKKSEKREKGDKKLLPLYSEEKEIKLQTTENDFSGNNGDSVKTLRQILEKNKAVTILLGKAKPRKTKAVITLLDNLPDSDAEAFNNTAHLIINMEDDLLEKIAHLHNENIKLRSKALIDKLTGLYNHRFFSAQLETEMARTRRTGLSCTLLMIDLDNFKRLNDTLGHTEGNKFLSSIAGSIRENVRPTDAACRYGGDEFMIILPATTINYAARTAQRLKNAIEKLSEPLHLGISASIGIAEFTVTLSWGVDEFINAADSAMYESKKKGKNRISVAEGKGLDEGEAGLVSPEEKEALFKVYDSLKKEGKNDDF
jgi:diguanylate cyclase (GGDEF)-like protein